MTPLTHAAVGTAIYQKLSRLQPWPWGTVSGCALAFMSHYLLDAIPHFEAIPPPLRRNYDIDLLTAAGLGLIGTLLSLLLMRRNREAGRILLILFLWASLGIYSPFWLRVLLGVLAIAYAVRTSRQWGTAGYLVAGMVAVAADFAPRGFRSLAALHDRMHFHTDFGTRLHLAFSQGSLPRSTARLHDPYFLLGYALELLIEGAIFGGAVYLFSRDAFPQAGRGGEIKEALELSEKSRGHAG